MTSGPLTVTAFPAPSTPPNIDCAVCAFDSELHHFGFSVVVPLAGTMMWSAVRLFTTNPSNMSISDVIVIAEPDD